ncbi:hypothetical protein KAS50_08100, partial [bacterium]|nr:hypothetical protein [bacterium]
MRSNKTKSKVITFMVVVYSLFCLVYSVAVHGKAQTSQESTQSAQIETIIKEADALFLKNKYDDAIKKYKEANNIIESFEAYKGIGSVYIQKAKYIDESKGLSYTVREILKEDCLESAINNFLKAESLNPGNDEIKTLLKNTYDLYYNTFKREYRAVSKESAKTDKVSNIDNIINEGDSLYSAKKYNDAIKRYKKANEVKET